jgi:hypothetical protein
MGVDEMIKRSASEIAVLKARCYEISEQLAYLYGEELNMKIQLSVNQRRTSMLEKNLSAYRAAMEGK